MNGWRISKNDFSSERSDGRPDFLSKMEENNRKAERMEFPISEVAAETARSFQALAKLQGKTFESSIEPLLSYTGEMKSIQRLFSFCWTMP